MIKFDINQQLVKPSADNKRFETKHEEKREDSGKVSNIIRKLKAKFDLTKEYMQPNKSVSTTEEDTDNNWYRYCGLAIRKMSNQGVSVENLLDFLVEHIIDMMLFDDKVDLLNYLYSLEVVDEKSFDGMAKDYLDRKILKTSRLTAIILYDMDKRKIMKLDERKNKWVDAEPEDIKDLSVPIKQNYSVNVNDFNNLVGFVGHDDKKKFMVFKFKNMKEKRHTGARCDQKTKAKILEIMNEIEGSEKYTKENTKGITQAELCPLQELIMRDYSKTKRNDKIWFLDPETAKIYGF
jgi:hypothetical protein